MSRVDARRRGIPRTGSTEMVRQACTIRLWAKRALFQLARVFPAVDRASSSSPLFPQFPGSRIVSPKARRVRRVTHIAG